MKYRSVMVTQRGGPEVLQVVENDLLPPAPGKVRVRVQATGVGRTDVNYRYGYSPLSPKAPFVPGYEIVGVVDALGEGVKGFTPGERVAALTGYGGYSEVIYLGQEHLVSVPPALPVDEVATLILNYVTAYQMLHRIAKVKAGDKALLIGASGGVGTALLQLGQLAGLKMYGTASPDKQPILRASGAVPIDYHSQDVIAALRQAEPGGVDFVFDGLGGSYSRRGLATLRRGGKLIGYAAPVGLLPLVGGLFELAWVNLLPNGKSATFYGISTWYARDKGPFKEDLPVLFQLLQDGQIKPIITVRLPLLEARRANELLENGQVVGNVVLLASG